MSSVEDAVAKRIGVVGVADGGVPLLDGIFLSNLRTVPRARLSC